jgi:transposase-like protein
VNNCPHCGSGHDPVLEHSTWSCGVRFNEVHWRTKECYKRELELANRHIKRLESAGDLLAEWHLAVVTTREKAERDVARWNKAKETKP